MGRTSLVLTSSHVFAIGSSVTVASLGQELRGSSSATPCCTSRILTSGVSPESPATGLGLLRFEVVEDRLTATGRLDDGDQTRQLGFEAPTLLRCDEELFE